jgi:hypothetical protein
MIKLEAIKHEVGKMGEKPRPVGVREAKESLVTLRQTYFGDLMLRLIPCN